MEKRNQDYCKADALAGLAVLVNRDADCLSDDYGLLESLASDTLSPNEARRFAEHLKSCEECRQECAAMWATGFYDDSPFGDRMRAFENDPASETDEDWKTIAVAFNEKLASIANRAAVSYSESIADDLYVAPEFKQAIADWEASKPKARPKTEPRKFVAKRMFAYTSAAVLLALVAAQFLGVAPDDAVEEIAMKPAVRATNDGENNLSSTFDDEEENGETMNRGLMTPRSPFGTVKSGDDLYRPSYQSLRRSAELFDNAQGADKFYRKGVAAFDNGKFGTAAEEFAQLVRLLKEKAASDAALIDAYWNWGVATAMNDKKAEAAEIWRALSEMDLDERTRQSVEAALENWEN